MLQKKVEKNFQNCSYRYDDVTTCLWTVTSCSENDSGLPSESKTKNKIGSSDSSWENIISGVPQCSILGHLLLNIFLCDLFLEHEESCFTNYADDQLLIWLQTIQRK